MSSLNPYAPPESELDPSGTDQPTIGRAWKEGDNLVIGRNSLLGTRCFATGAETLRHITIQVDHNPRWIYPLAVLAIVPFLVARASTRKSAELTIPIAPHVYATHRKRVNIGLLLCLAGFAGVVAALNVGFPFLVLVAFIAGVVGFALSSREPVQIKVVSFKDDLLKVSGVHPVALEAFPDRATVEA